MLWLGLGVRDRGVSFGYGSDLHCGCLCGLEACFVMQCRGDLIGMKAVLDNYR